ncbi:MAG: ATP-binding protein, partial [Steroidobacteraceae bacterium]
PMEEAPPLRSLQGEVIKDEEQIVRTPRTGSLRHRQVSSSPVRNANGEIIGAVSVVRDVTERKRAQAALEEADRRKNVFLATLSHELRNPLAPIRTAARLLESRDLSQENLKRCRTIIARQVGQLGSLLDDLLDVSRLTRGELTLKRSTVPLRQVLDAAVEAAQPLIGARHHRLELDFPPLMPRIVADSVRLTQVVSNLLTNAAKYTPEGGAIVLGFRLEPEALELFVRDNGIGLAPQQQEQIFEMFVRAEPAAERTDGGLGIGLALVKALVELHDGRVGVQSAGRDAGSTFTVTLPKSIVAASEAAPRDQAAADAPPARLHRVLVADDNADGADVLATLLQLAGHEVHVAHDGLEALEIAARVRPDVALLDIGMPGMSGYDLAARIRSEPWGGGMLLVAVTGWGQEDDKRKAKEAGFDHHLTKPMDPTLLEAILASPAP